MLSLPEARRPGRTEIKMMIYRNQIIKNMGEKRIKSTEGGFGLRGQAHLHLRLIKQKRGLPYRKGW